MSSSRKRSSLSRPNMSSQPRTTTAALFMRSPYPHARLDSDDYVVKPHPIPHFPSALERGITSLIIPEYRAISPPVSPTSTTSPQSTPSPDPTVSPEPEPDPLDHLTIRFGGRLPAERAGKMWDYKAALATWRMDLEQAGVADKDARHKDHLRLISSGFPGVTFFWGFCPSAYSDFEIPLAELRTYVRYAYRAECAVLSAKMDTSTDPRKVFEEWIKEAMPLLTIDTFEAVCGPSIPIGGTARLKGVHDASLNELAVAIHRDVHFTPTSDLREYLREKAPWFDQWCLREAPSIDPPEPLSSHKRAPSTAERPIGVRAEEGSLHGAT